MEKSNPLQNHAMHAVPTGNRHLSEPGNVRQPRVPASISGTAHQHSFSFMPPFGFAVGMSSMLANKLRSQIARNNGQPERIDAMSQDSRHHPSGTGAPMVGLLASSSPLPALKSEENTIEFNHSTAEHINDMATHALKRKMGLKKLPPEHMADPIKIGNWLKADNTNKELLLANQKSLAALQDRITQSDNARKPHLKLHNGFLHIAFDGIAFKSDTDQQRQRQRHLGQPADRPQVNYKHYLTPDDNTVEGREKYVNDFVLAAVEWMQEKPETKFHFKVCTLIDDVVVVYADNLAGIQESMQICHDINQSINALLCERWGDFGRTSVGIDNHGAGVPKEQRSETSILAHRIATKARRLIASGQQLTEESFIRIAALETIRRAELMKKLGLDPFKGHSEKNIPASPISEQDRDDILRKLLRCDIAERKAIEFSPAEPGNKLHWNYFAPSSPGKAVER